EKKAQEIFSKIDGVGKTEVKISVKAGYQNDYVNDLRTRMESNGEYADSEYNNETVLINEGNREKPLLKKIIYPEYLGAVIVCDGGDDSNIRLQLTQAMRSLTGISSDNIVVAKMKK
ncbi:MAG: hypothetical protein IJS65_06985, partial [Clostridia bacterium]|nr:hypothetical protein [Clostridia bacterium]